MGRKMPWSWLVAAGGQSTSQWVQLVQSCSCKQRGAKRGAGGGQATQLAASFPKHPGQGIIAVNFWVQLGLAARENMSCSNIQLRRSSFSHLSRTPTSRGPPAHRALPGDAPCCCCRRRCCTHRCRSPRPAAAPSRCRASSLLQTPASGSWGGQRGAHLPGGGQQPPLRLPAGPDPTQKLGTARYKSLLAAQGEQLKLVLLLAAAGDPQGAGWQLGFKFNLAFAHPKCS